jgi:hypothetical protein
MFIVKIIDYSECYLHRTIFNEWTLKKSVKYAETFTSEKMAARAVKEWHKEKTGRSLHIPMKLMPHITILKKEG